MHVKNSNKGVKKFRNQNSFSDFEKISIEKKCRFEVISAFIPFPLHVLKRGSGTWERRVLFMAGSVFQRQTTCELHLTVDMYLVLFAQFISDVGLKAPCIKEMNLLEKFNPKPVFLYEFIYSSVDDVKMSNQTWIGKLLFCVEK